MRTTLPLIILVFFFACGEPDHRETRDNQVIVKSPIEIKSSDGNYKIREGDTFSIDVICSKQDTFSEISLLLNDSVYLNPQDFPFGYSFETTKLPLGTNRIKVSAVTGDKVESKTITFTLLSGTSPVQYTFQIEAEFPHDPKAYTQGLLFHEGHFYEGTGQKGLSSLRKVNPKDGSIVQKVDLNKEIFGEGITIFQDHIYQLSWSSKVGFVYDISTLEEINRFYYSGEGWGLTNDEEHLIKSNGTERITFHMPETFREIRALEVYSNEGPVDKLNELEYIDGKIWANIWQTEKIAIINPENGRLEGLVDLKGILPGKDRDQNTDVLNGIAYDSDNNRLFITGKYWSKIFQISIREVKKSI